MADIWIEHYITSPCCGKPVVCRNVEGELQLHGETIPFKSVEQKCPRCKRTWVVRS